MGDLVSLIQKQKYEVDYILEDGKVIGITHPKWPFRIMRKDGETAFVCEDTDEPFGILNRDIFNTILMCWLLIDDPELVDGSSKEE